jgi:hypothetical protein
MTKSLYDVRDKLTHLPEALSAFAAVATAFPHLNTEKVVGVVSEMIDEFIEARADEKRLIQEREAEEAKRSSLIKPEDAHKYKLGNRGYQGYQGSPGVQGCTGPNGPVGSSGAAGEGGLIILPSSAEDEESPEGEEAVVEEPVVAATDSQE